MFGSNAESISQQAQIKALKSGINLTLIPDTLPFATLFDTNLEGDHDEQVTSIDGVLTDIYAGRVVTSPQQVINRLTTTPTEAPQQQGMGWDEDLDYTRIECLFMAHLRRYLLSGKGPQRAHKLVKLMTGDEYLPLSPLGTLTVSSSSKITLSSSLTHMCRRSDLFLSSMNMA